MHRKNCDPFVLGPAGIYHSNNARVRLGGENVGTKELCLGTKELRLNSPFAMLRIPLPVCFSVKFSSANFEP